MVRHGSRWLFSAGFNVGRGDRTASRIVCEIGDLRALAAAGARVAVLSHQGGNGADLPRHLDDVADVLAERLGVPVGYEPFAVGAAAVARASAMRAGEVVLFGNTRMLNGESTGSPALARELARLGDRLVVGGFCKAHRDHASNSALARELPSVVATSVVDELRLLEQWGRRDPARPVGMVLGGRKLEKLHPGLLVAEALADVVIAGGIVLNALLAARGYRVGRSWLGTDPNRAVALARAALDRGIATRLVAPEAVVYADEAGRRHELKLPGDVPDGATIQDFRLPVGALDVLTQGRGGRLMICGTPTDASAGDTIGLRQLVDGAAAAELLTLGGDTATDVGDAAAARSDGGGAALETLAGNPLPALDSVVSGISRT